MLANYYIFVWLLFSTDVPISRYSDPAPLICGEYPGQAGGEYPRDVGHGQDRGRLDLWGAAGGHDGPPPLPHPVPEPAAGGEAIQRSAGSSDPEVPYYPSNSPKERLVF